MIKFKGYQVAPAELEDILLSHDAVSDAAVIGVFDEELQTELPVAYIVLKKGVVRNEETALDILDYLKGRTVNYKHLRGGLVWIDLIPKSSSGKILKRELRVRLGDVDRGKRIGGVDYSRYRAKL